MISTIYKYSFVLPIYNPEKSLITALKCYSKLKYKNFEIIIVDDSNENIFDKMKLNSLNLKNLTYFHRNKTDGLDSAFNFGIKKSNGDIIVIATDDNMPEEKFLDKLNLIYNQGYDVVIGRSKVNNSSNLFALYQSSYENFFYNKKNYKPKWSEGFSAKKKCLISIGMYPNVGIDGGNDNLLSDRLEKKYKVKRDFKLIMHHRAPNTLSEFFKQQIQRGSAGPQFDLKYFKYSKFYILTKYLLKFFITIFNLITQIYYLYLTFLYFRYSKNKNISFFLKILLSINMKWLFHSFGEIKIIKKML